LKINEITPIYVGHIPDVLEEGFLYISKEFNVALHLCACGCGKETVTPIDTMSGWVLTEHPNGAISLSPSIGNFYFPCKSHYFIKENKILWL
jgi:hypothetical protein